MRPAVRWACVVAIVLGPFLLYGPALTGGLIWDDLDYIYLASLFETTGNLEQLQWLWLPRRDFAMGTYRPFVELTFMYEWKLWGVETLGYRLVNLLMHIGSSFLLVSLVAHLSRNRLAGWVAGVLFAISPAHPETCMWLCCRGNLSATFFMLAAMRAFVGGRHVLAPVLTLCSLSGKETALALPPILAMWAWIRAHDEPWRARVLTTLKLSAAHFVVLGIYFWLRLHVLGEVFGIYEWRERPNPLSLTYLAERARLLYVTLAPFNVARAPEMLRYVMFLGNAIASAWLIWLAFRGSRGVRTFAWCALAWFFGTNVPIYDAPFGPDTIVDLRSSRFLYEPTSAMVAGVALVLVRLRAWRRTVAIVGLCGLSFVIAFANVGPWCETEAISARLQRMMREGSVTEPRLVVDLPDFHDGAFLFPIKDRMVSPLFADATTMANLQLVRIPDWADALNRIDAHLKSGRSDGLEILALRDADRVSARFEPEPVPAIFPLRLSPAIELRCARCNGFDVVPGGPVDLYMLFEFGPGGGSQPLQLRLVSDTEDGVSWPFTRPSAEADGRQALHRTLLLPADARPGRYTVEIEFDGRSWPIASIDVGAS